MADTKLIPGFRFHPTDVELVVYFLKRKILGQKFPFDVIAELDIYKYAPWDLPDKSLLRTGDLKWYFFCPRGMKYSTGGRSNRATECGFWKTTGKDRSIEHRNQVVGMIRTLVFHTGRAPKGDRTDWVMHEFRIELKDLADKGIAQDSYVICRVFQKEGPGPRNGAQYGKPFNEEDWDQEEEIYSEQSVPVATICAPGPDLPTASLVAIASDMHTSQGGYMGLTSGSCLSGLAPSCFTHPSAPSNQVDGFKEDDSKLAVNEYNINENVDNPDQENNAEGAPNRDPNEIFDELGDLDSLLGLGEGDIAFCGQEFGYTTSEMLSMASWCCDPQDNFLELNDLDS